jgi:hypothetical protein
MRSSLNRTAFRLGFFAISRSPNSMNRFYADRASNSTNEVEAIVGQKPV